MDLDALPKVRSTRDQVEAALSILIQQQRPGDQLPPEPELARQLGVSRPTLREALRTFADRGLLVRRQGVGTFVASRLPVLETGLCAARRPLPVRTYAPPRRRFWRALSVSPIAPSGWG